jgi:hypothetical protein
VSYRITADNVRRRLRTIPSVTLSDGDLYSPSYIPLAEAKIDQWLTNNSLTFSGLTATQQTLLIGAEIVTCCLVVLTEAPNEAVKSGIVSFTPIDAQDRATILDKLAKELQELLGLCGIKNYAVGGSTSGGDDYIPDGLDNRNINWSDNNLSVWDLFP